MIDTHAHLEYDSFHDSIDDIFERALNNNVHTIVTVGVNLRSSRNAVSLAQQHSAIFAAVGVQPDDIVELDTKENHRELEQLVQQERVKAVGEIGLDYCRIEENDITTKDLQKKYFTYQLRLAKQYDLPVIIHSRKSAEDTLQIIKTEKPDRAVLHCYGYDLEYAQQFLSLNSHYNISFTGIVTFPNAKIMQDVARAVPLERIMVETDCPLLAPQKYRGQTNEPSYVIEVALKIAELQGISFDMVEKQTDENARKFFCL